MCPTLSVIIIVSQNDQEQTVCMGCGLNTTCREEAIQAAAAAAATYYGTLERIQDIKVAIPSTRGEFHWGVPRTIWEDSYLGEVISEKSWTATCVSEETQKASSDKPESLPRPATC